MAIYHLSVKNGAPAMGKAHAAYIEREGIYSAKEDLQYSESGNLPSWAQHDAQTFWHAADLYERKNGRPFREIEIALPREFNEEQRIELVRDFVKNTLGERHAYTWAIHNPKASDGLEQPHAHIMFTERVNDGIERDPHQFFRRWNAREPEKGGAGKDRYLSSRQFVRDIREEWAITANHYLEKAGLEIRIDHRSYLAQGIELEPQLKKGLSTYVDNSSVLKEITSENRDRAYRNGERLLEHPEIAFKALTATQSVFSRRDLEHFVFRNSDSAEQYQAVYQRLMNSPDLIALKIPDKHGDYYTSRELHQIEIRLIERAHHMGEKTFVPLDQHLRQDVEHKKNFNPGQKDAYQLLTSEAQLAAVNGAAGTGKSYVLGAAREAYEHDGYRVVGAALQGKTADDMQRDAGIPSQTIHSLVAQLEKGQTAFDRKTVLVIDEAGMVGSRQLEKLLDHAQQADAKVRLVGDAWQLHAVDAGDAFKHVSHEVKTASLTKIMRQNHDWQREASTALSRHDISQGMAAYQERGFIREQATQHEARASLLEQWQKDREVAPQHSQILLAHTNVEREALNRMVREIKHKAGELGQDHAVKANGKTIPLAEGDRIMFTQNEYVMKVKNGTMGDIEKIHDDTLTVRLGDGRTLNVNTQHYGHFDHGYAVTIHKSQGVTVDRAYVLATPTMNAELTYVGMTRHKEALYMTYSREHFKDATDLEKSLSRPENKAFSAHYAIDERLRERDHHRLTLAERRAEALPNTLSLKERFEQSALRQQEKVYAELKGLLDSPKVKKPLEAPEHTPKESLHLDPHQPLQMSPSPLMAQLKEKMEQAAKNTFENRYEQRYQDALAHEKQREQVKAYTPTKVQSHYIEHVKKDMHARGEPQHRIDGAEFKLKERFYNKDIALNRQADKLYISYQKEQEKHYQSYLDKGLGRW